MAGEAALSVPCTVCSAQRARGAPSAVSCGCAARVGAFLRRLEGVHQLLPTQVTRLPSSYPIVQRCVCAWVCACAYLDACMRVCVRPRARVCVCMYACVRVSVLFALRGSCCEGVKRTLERFGLSQL